MGGAPGSTIRTAAGATAAGAAVRERWFVALGWAAYNALATWAAMALHALWLLGLAPWLVEDDEGGRI